MQREIRAQAIEWHVRLRDDDEAWEDFAVWLGEDAAHAEQYALVEQSDRAIEPMLPLAEYRKAANDIGDEIDETLPVANRKRWWIAGGALAASIALGIMVVPHFAPQRYQVATAAGENQIVTLDKSTRITLNGATRMMFDKNNPRFAALIAGEALFHVRHDKEHPFRLEVGDDIVEDAGTVFNVVREGHAVRVSVAEGRVVYNPGRQAVALGAGEALVDSQSDAPITVESTSVEAVGAWQRGQLVYTGEPFAQVAADLSRALGVRITVTPRLANRPFHGTIALDGSGPDQIKRLQLALNIILEAGPDGWIMKPPAGGAR